jgi:hypothetical protein
MVSAVDQLAAVLRGIPYEQLVGVWAGEGLKAETEMFERNFPRCISWRINRWQPHPNRSGS